MVSNLINANPVVYEKKDRRTRSAVNDVDEYVGEPIDQQEIFDILLAWLLCLKQCVRRLNFASYIFAYYDVRLQPV